jgi:hypothetical protein
VTTPAAAAEVPADPQSGRAGRIIVAAPRQIDTNKRGFHQVEHNTGRISAPQAPINLRCGAGSKSLDAFRVVAAVRYIP